MKLKYIGAHSSGTVKFPSGMELPIQANGIYDLDEQHAKFAVESALFKVVDEQPVEVKKVKAKFK